MFKRMRNCCYDDKRPDNKEVRQKVFRILSLIWEMYQSDWGRTVNWIASNRTRLSPLSSLKPSWLILRRRSKPLFSSLIFCFSSVCFWCTACSFTSPSRGEITFLCISGDPDTRHNTNQREDDVPETLFACKRQILTVIVKALSRRHVNKS